MNKVIPFVLGAAAGSVVTWLAVKQYYKRIADEEIESVVERFKNRERTSAGLSVAEPHTETESVTTTATYENTANYTMQKEEYEKLLEDNGYSSTPGDDNYAVFTGDDGDTPPFVIAPEDFGETGFDTKTFKYFKDFVLTDDEGEIVLDPENIIGDALSRFGAYGDDDAVYVRNSDVECDYEILKDERTFKEIYGGLIDDDAE